MERIPCSCGGENERCYKCDGRGWYEDRDPDSPLRLSLAPLPAPSTRKPRAAKRTKKPSSSTQPKNSNASVVATMPHTVSTPKRRRIVLDNPLPPPLIPPERMPKRLRAYARPADERPRKGAVRHVVLIYKDIEFACTYDPTSLQGAQDTEVAAEFLARLFLLERGRFLETRTLRKLSILTPATADLFVVDRTGDVVKYALTRNGIPRRVGIVRSAVSQAKSKRRGKDVGERGRFGRDRAASTESPADAVRQAATHPGQSERELDATRDYWRLRDHGQFGSYPSHDDFDE